MNLDTPRRIGPPTTFLYLGLGKYAYQEYIDGSFDLFFQATSAREFTITAAHCPTKNSAILCAFEHASKRLADAV